MAMLARLILLLAGIYLLFSMMDWEVLGILVLLLLGKLAASGK